MAEDYNMLRRKVRELVKTDFKFSWQFRLEVEDEPTDFDLFVKDISYGPTEIENEPLQVGGRVLTYPKSAAPVTLAVTLREHTDERISKWFDALAAKAVHADGTVGLPFGTDGYVKTFRRYSIQADSSEVESGSWKMYPVQRGDVTESREEPGHLEFPATFIQFRS